MGGYHPAGRSDIWEPGVTERYQSKFADQGCLDMRLHPRNAVWYRVMSLWVEHASQFRTKRRPRNWLIRFALSATTQVGRKADRPAGGL